MLKTYEFKLQPTKCQKQRLVDMLDAARYVYNWGLEDRVNMYRYAKYSTSFYDQSKYLKELLPSKLSSGDSRMARSQAFQGSRGSISSTPFRSRNTETASGFRARGSPFQK